MNTTARRLLEEALQLPEPDRADLAAELIQSLDPGAEEDADEDVEAAWAAEITRRIAELDAGTAECVPWAEVRRMMLEGLDYPDED